jgi:hypothetical protein
MADLIDKISSYNLFNYLLPGVLFSVIASKLTHYTFLGYEIVVAAFLYYFIGLVVSRFGSLVIEPFFEFTGFVKFADYRTFIAASKQDPRSKYSPKLTTPIGRSALCLSCCSFSNCMND